MTDAASIHDLVRALAQGPLSIGGLVLARIAPISLLSPVFGGAAVPRRFRVAIALMLATTLTPMLLADAHPIVDPVRFAGLFVKELAIGVAIAIAITFVFDMLQAVGAICDHVRAANLADIVDPFSAGEQTVLSLFLKRLLLVIFFSLGGHVPLIEGLAASFQTAPIGEAMPAWLTGRDAATQSIALLADMSAVAVRLSAPVIVVTLAAELAVGLLGRIHQSIETDLPSRSVKLLLGLLVFFMILGYGLPEALGDGMRRLAQMIGGG